jgi:peptidoglycan-N-acetylglucosamine deacetylase
MISVVVPAFNEENYIRECLESLKNQDYAGDYEIIVVDNGCTDKTAQIVQDMGVRLVRCLKKGVSHARQAGSEASSAEIIVQADADTLYPRWWLSRIWEQFRGHPEAAAIAGTFIYSHPPWWAYAEYSLRVIFNYLSFWVLGRPFIISGANLAFYKKHLVKIGGYDQSAYSSDQFNISTRLSKVGKIIYDSRSWCATSNRSVAKPIYVIVRDFFRHLSYFARHILNRSKVPNSTRSGNAWKVSRKTLIISLIGLILVGLLSYGYFIPASPIFGKVYVKGTAPGKVIALTFDDGPNEPYTSQILDFMEEQDIQATFFLVGANVELFPDTVRRMVADGDVIGNHTYSHNANHALEFNAYRDIQAAQQAIFEAAGVKPHLYRPPHGKKSPWELQAIKEEGYIEVLWSISTSELNGKSPASMADDIVKKARPGGIVLMHDGYGTLHGSGRALKESTLPMVKLVVDELKSQGYHFVTVPDLLNVSAYNKVVP